ncbi:response regulator [Aggregicoccus sp. 17bor-14]|uniref:response regulator n=1 Tax=Myxococcaceae TaxID=31 RepID=UPI00129CE139|nr:MULTISPECIES: response regulator [Myxococcaceae]MBF5045258.1 response regulator [Simulacricoccus sp. 17bor-14]MRI90999.1 response regulator [Aggregicoccus sp. 17bor-14]
MTSSPPRPILVVEDEHDIREAVSDLLQMEGYAVETACNGQEALELLERPADPCLILLDVMMPVMDGHAFMARLRAHERHARIPVVITSASPQVPEGARAHLRKPYELHRLLDVIAEHRTESHT